MLNPLSENASILFKLQLLLKKCKIEKDDKHHN